MGLKEFLAECGVHEPSCSTVAQTTMLDKGASACGLRQPSCSTLAQTAVLHEGAGEGPRRIIFDLENISEHKKAIAAIVR